MPLENGRGHQAMAVSIATLPVVHLDYTNRGPGVHLGLVQLEAMLSAERGREGYLTVQVKVNNATIPVVMARHASVAMRPQWKEALRTLLVVVSENVRLIPVSDANHRALERRRAAGAARATRALYPDVGPGKYPVTV
jgi:hypothetical protein